MRVVAGIAPAVRTRHTWHMPRNKLSKDLEKLARERGLLMDDDVPGGALARLPSAVKKAERRQRADYFLSATFFAPVRIESEMNSREHWSSRRRRFDRQCLAVREAMRPAGGFVKDVGEWMKSQSGVVRVKLTRVGKRKLDSDNLAGGFKAVRDQIAFLIGVDDGSDLYVWEYAQEVGAEYGITIDISTEAA